jgi:cellulose synthase/poly-beta-1,6-N-acetylglucosamine synthase-like glycosyltransferase
MMIYIACFVVFLTVLQFLVALANLLFRPSLKKGQINQDSLVSVLIPARNEEKNISVILNDVINQDYKNIEIIVFNDQSDDKTPEIVNKFALQDKRIKLINSDGLPDGWLGKNYACYNLSKHATGDYFLFLDADVRIKNDIITNSVFYLKKHNLGLVSIFPKQLMKGFGEKITVPVMNFILLTLLPLILVRISKKPSLAAANGQFMFFNAEIYNKMQPHEKMKNNKVEDIAIARYYKNNKIPVDCLVGDETIMCRMYNSFSEAVNGFSKNVIAFFGNSFFLALIFWITTTFGFLFILLAFPVKVFILYLMLLLLIRVIISIISHQNIINNLMFIVLQQASFGLFIYKAFMNKIMNKYLWKGRPVS